MPAKHRGEPGGPPLQPARGSFASSSDAEDERCSPGPRYAELLCDALARQPSSCTGWHGSAMGWPLDVTSQSWQPDRTPS